MPVKKIPYMYAFHDAQPFFTQDYDNIKAAIRQAIGVNKSFKVSTHGASLDGKYLFWFNTAKNFDKEQATDLLALEFGKTELRWDANGKQESLIIERSSLAG